MRDIAKKKYFFNTAQILILMYLLALLPLSGFSCACDAAEAAQDVEGISLSPCCCSADACSENAPAKPVRPVRAGDPLCNVPEMCCCSSVDDYLFDLQTAAVKHEYRSSLNDDRYVIVLPAFFMPSPAAELCAQVVRLSECRSPVSPHIPITILLL